jgi:hypothetical protein
MDEGGPGILSGGTMNKEKIETEIKRWEKMILWAEAQNPMDYYDFFKMLNDIGDAPDNLHSEFCKEFHDECNSSVGVCPIYAKFGVCGVGQNKYPGLQSYIRYKKWVRKAKLFLEQIKTIGGII